MYSSPAVRLYTSENTESLVQRKPGFNHISRKPFVDRSVNSKTPDTNKAAKSKIPVSKDFVGLGKPTHNDLTCAEIPKVSVSPKSEDLSAEDYIFSGRHVEASHDNFWPDLHLGREGIKNILRNYCQIGDTPPPSPTSKCADFPIDIDPIFFELPPADVQLRPFILEESFESVDVPTIDSDDDLDSSV